MKKNILYRTFLVSTYVGKSGREDIKEKFQQYLCTKDTPTFSYEDILIIKDFGSL